MCNSITMLAQLSDHRFVAVCEHSTVHIYWERFTLYMRPGEFSYLCQCLDEVIAGVTYPWSEDPDYLEQSFMIWVDDFALRLQGIDFCYFTDLVEEAKTKVRIKETSQPLEATIKVVQDESGFESKFRDLIKIPTFKLN
ncbi:MAG: hypothetical protein AAF629_24010 [Chloroflexota bacterium]